MPNETDFSPLSDLIDKAIIFLDRSSVQGQLVAILAVLLIAGLIAKRMTSAASATLESIDQSDRPRPRWQRYGLPLAVNIVFPLSGIILLLLIGEIWRIQGWYAGLITIAFDILIIYFFYRLAIGLLYALFPDQQVRRYHRRLFGPLFAVFVIGLVLSQLADLGEMGQVVVGTLYDNPVTLGALLLATVGLYFWITSVWAVQDVSSQAIKARISTDTSSVDAYLTLGRYILILIGLLIVFSALNLNPATVAAILGGLAVGLSFGLREIVSNFVSGIWLLIERSVRPGDIIEVDGTTGTVVELTMRATIVRTYDNVLLIVPNPKLFTSTVKTFTHDDRSIRGLVFIRVSPDNSADQVMRIMQEVVQEHPLICEDPAPSVTFEDFNLTVAEFRLAFWLDDISNRISVSSELRSAISVRFAEEKIELLPQTAIVAGVPRIDS